MAGRGFSIGFALIGLIVFPGCSHIIDGTGRGLLAADETRSQSVEGEGPLDVQIAQAFRREGQLTVNVHVKARSAIDTDAVVVSVVGLRDGETVEEQSQRLKEVVASDQLRKGESASLFFTLPVAGLSEYQVKCSWGEDALVRKDAVASREVPQATETAALAPEKTEDAIDAGEIPVIEPLVGSEEPQGEKGVLALARTALEKQTLPCASEPCDLVYTVTAQLVNGSPSTVTSATLAVGLYWQAERNKATVPQDREPLLPSEEKFELSGISLLPGQSKKVRVKVDRPIPVVPGGSFQAYLRIIEP